MHKTNTKQKNSKNTKTENDNIKNQRKQQHAPKTSTEQLLQTNLSSRHLPILTFWNPDDAYENLHWTFVTNQPLDTDMNWQ